MPSRASVVTGARVGGSHNSGQSFLDTSRREGRVSSAQSMPKYPNAPSRYHMSRLTALSHQQSDEEDEAQPPFWSELNLCIPYETIEDRQMKESCA